MPYIQRMNAAMSLGTTEAQQLILEFDAIRRELDEMRAAFMSMRAALVAGTAIGAAYNVPATDLGTFTPNTAVSNRRFTPT